MANDKVLEPMATVNGRLWPASLLYCIAILAAAERQVLCSRAALRFPAIVLVTG